MHEFQTEVANTGIQPAIKMRARFLSLGAKHCVAASDVGDNGVCSTCGVAQRDLVLLAGTAAILEAGAVREESAEDAMLGVKDR